MLFPRLYDSIFVYEQCLPGVPCTTTDQHGLFCRCVCAFQRSRALSRCSFAEPMRPLSRASFDLCVGAPFSRSCGEQLLNKGHHDMSHSHHRAPKKPQPQKRIYPFAAQIDTRHKAPAMPNCGSAFVPFGMPERARQKFSLSFVGRYAVGARGRARSQLGGLLHSVKIGSKYG